MPCFMPMETPIGSLYILETDGAVSGLTLPGQEAPALPEKKTALLERAAGQLWEYFAGRRPVFDLPIAPKGTAFQRAVWEALRTIPAGETRSYGDIARMVNRPKAFRAVGMANHQNPLPIIIPCHRVIGASGKLVGYGGGLPVKAALLNLESRFYKGQG